MIGRSSTICVESPCGGLPLDWARGRRCTFGQEDARRREKHANRMCWLALKWSTDERLSTGRGGAGVGYCVGRVGEVRMRRSTVISGGAAVSAFLVHVLVLVASVGCATGGHMGDDGTAGTPSGIAGDGQPRPGEGCRKHGVGAGEGDPERGGFAQGPLPEDDACISQLQSDSVGD